MAAGWLKKAVRLLNHADELGGQGVKARYRALLAEMREQAKSSPWLGQVAQCQLFFNITDNYFLT